MSGFATLHEATLAVIRSVLGDVNIALPGKVEKFDWKTARASVKPQIKRLYDDATLEALPVIVGVPVSFPMGSGGSLTFPIAKGDTGLLIFSDRAIDIWLSKGGDAAPGDARRFDITDAVFIPGIHPFNVDSPAEDGTSLILKQGLAKIKLNAGKLSIEGAGAELLDLLDQLITKLMTTTVPTAVGTYPLSTAISGELTAIKALLALIKQS